MDVPWVQRSSSPSHRKRRAAACALQQGRSSSDPQLPMAGSSPRDRGLLQRHPCTSNRNNHAGPSKSPLTTCVKINCLIGLPCRRRAPQPGWKKILLNRLLPTCRVFPRDLDSCSLSVNPRLIGRQGLVLGCNTDTSRAQEDLGRKTTSTFSSQLLVRRSVLEPARIQNIPTRAAAQQKPGLPAFGSLFALLSSGIRGIRAANSNFGTLDRQDLVPFWDLAGLHLKRDPAITTDLHRSLVLPARIRRPPALHRTTREN